MSFPSLVALALDRLDQLHVRHTAKRRRGVTRAPQVGDGRLAPLRLVDRFELEVEGDPVGIADRPVHAMAADAQLLALNRIAVERRLPDGVVTDPVLQS